ncbi:MAG: hypothetical protein QJR03_06980 [Sphaerobacter sp.]|nr:hypothetical protein [Sphaerobacter sp.]
MARERLAFLNAVAIGILFFLFVDIVEHAAEPIEALATRHAGETWLLLFLLIVGFAGGLLSLVYYAQRTHRVRSESAERTALVIAAGIGLHNFSEGLAIGSSSHAGGMTLALMLIIGFGLHNATEGFGIAAPLAGQTAGWGFLAVAGLIAGGPTFLGTLLGYFFFSRPVSVLFLALASGAIMYVIGELMAAGRRLGAPTWNGWGLTVGLLAGVLTEVILSAAGG